MRRFKIVFLLFLIFFFTIFIILFCGKSEHHYIAHAGGAIDGIRYTNSKEAILNSISKGAKYIELDLSLTRDGKLVAVHDWHWFNELTNTDSLMYEIPS